MSRWEEGSRESRRILLPLYDDPDELRNAVGPQKLPRRITACHRGVVKFVERGDSEAGDRLASFSSSQVLRFRASECLVRDVDESHIFAGRLRYSEMPLI